MPRNNNTFNKPIKVRLALPQDGIFVFAAPGSALNFSPSCAQFWQIGCFIPSLPSKNILSKLPAFCLKVKNTKPFKAINPLG